MNTKNYLNRLSLKKIYKMKYNQEKRMFLINKFLKLESVRLVQRAYRTEYVTSIAPADSTIRNIVSNFQKTG